MKNFQKVVALIALSGICMAAPVPSEGDASAKKKAHASSAKKESTDEKLRQLKEMIEQQQAAMQQMQQQLQQTQQQLQQTQQQLAQTQQSAQQANAKVATVETNSTLQVQKVQSDLTDVKTALASTTTTLQADEKRVKNLEEPTTIHYKGLSLTPGGFLESDFIVRSRNENADIANGYTSIPLDNSSNAKLTELRGTARPSRLALLAEGMAGKTKLSGYYEIDFLGAAPTANQVQVNAWTPRLRQAWAQAEMPGGWTVTAGQMWSLITTDRKGIATRAEFIPIVADGNYHVGYNFVRQTAVRVTKKLNEKSWAAFEVANPETTVTGVAPANLMGLNTSTTDSTGVLILPYSANYSNGVAANLAPDLIAKVAFEPGFGHYEIKALGRFFRDRVAGTATTAGATNKSYGGGLGFAAILPLVPKKLDFIAEGLFGRGIGRYGAAGLADNTLDPNTGKLLPLREAQFMAGVEVHPSPKLDIFLYGGDEYAQRLAKLTSSGGAAGYGSPLTSFAACTNEVAMNSCAGSNRNIYETTAGYWYRFYKGPYGTFQYGNQILYMHRNLWRGVGSAPEGGDVVAYTTLRFYLP